MSTQPPHAGIRRDIPQSVVVHAETTQSCQRRRLLKHKTRSCGACQRKLVHARIDGPNPTHPSDRPSIPHLQLSFRRAPCPPRGGTCGPTLGRSRRGETEILLTTARPHWDPPEQLAPRVLVGRINEVLGWKISKHAGKQLAGMVSRRQLKSLGPQTGCSMASAVGSPRRSDRFHSFRFAVGACPASGLALASQKFGSILRSLVLEHHGCQCCAPRMLV